MKIDTYKEWSRRPSWHCDYSDYVRHMENEARIQQKELIKQAVREALEETFEGRMIDNARIGNESRS